ncbi:MAG: phosphoribosylformylglycinamidine synthase, purS protein [Thaumarchaeota archaeon]|nr:MAG: phosphoribosylformylglycinamidine synthase, purS protein [Nitrososphaerota archaeon]
MPTYEALIEVWLKDGIVDAEGRSVTEALQDIGYPIKDTRVGKVYRIILEAGSPQEAERLVDEICRRLLVNPVKDRYTFRVEER